MISLLVNRRSIRKYKKQPIEKQKIEQLFKAALLSPSSRGINPWEFIIVDEKDEINKLSKSKAHGSQFLNNAPVAIVIVADKEKSDVCVEDCSIAATIIQLQAERLGLGSCWIQIRNRHTKEEKSSEQYIKEILTIPDNYMVEAIISIGYKDEVKEPHNLENIQYEKIHYNSYGILYKGKNE